MQIALAQLEIKTGDLRGNTDLILGTIESKQGNDVILFPELVVTGYNCGALFESDDFIDDVQKHIDEIVQATVGKKATVIFGAPRFATPAEEKNGNIRLHNSAFVVRDGKIISIYDKILLANDFQHEDRKYFVPGDHLVTVNVAGQTAGILICEDIWAPDHDRDLVAELKAVNPDISMIFCLNYSYYTYEKHSARKKLLSKLAKQHGVHIFYVNAVGVGDIVKNFMIYDGRSLAYRKDGQLIDFLPAFTPQVACYDWADDMPLAYFGTLHDEKYADIWEALQYSLRSIMDQCHVENAQVHVSGGIDSAVVAALCAKALGSDRCVFISNPSVYNGSVTKGNAQYVADKLGVPLYWVPVKGVASQAYQDIKYASCVDDEDQSCSPWKHKEIPKMVDTTLDAVGRTLLGLSMCHMFRSAIISTGNHTENVLGWFTFHDVGSVGLFQPLGDLTKSEVNGLADFINKTYREEIIPRSLYNGVTKPMAELADSTEDPFDYPLYSGICAEMIRNRMTVRDLEFAYDNKSLTRGYFPECNPYDYTKEVFMKACQDSWNRSKRSVFKCAQASPTLILSHRSRGFSSRETIINHYQQ